MGDPLLSAAREFVGLPMGAGLKLEDLLTHPDGFGLPASQLQRAVCRALDGLPVGEWTGHVPAAFGGAPPAPTVPREFVLLSGIRSGKSLMAAARAIQCTQTCQLGNLVPGEVPRVSVVSVKKDLADVIFGFVVGHVQARPALRRLLVGEPTADTVVLRHPSGRPVEIKVTAGSRAGSSLVARWSAGVIFDEAPRMIGSEDGVINLDDARAAVIGRILPGASIIYCGSPWAPFGPTYNWFREHHGKTGAPVLVIKAPAYAMNPHYWTKSRCAALLASDPATYLTDVEAEFADRVAAFFPADAVSACQRAGQVDAAPVSGCQYVAAMDPATRGNAWTLGIMTVLPGGKRQLAAVRQWQGSAREPLSPDAVMDSIAQVCRMYGARTVASDQWSADALRDIAARHGLQLDIVSATASSKTDWFGGLRAAILDRRVDLPAVRELSEDLARVQRRVTQAGVAIDLPITADGRHCDYAAMLALLHSRPITAPVLTVADSGMPPGMAEAIAAAARRNADREGDL